MQENVSGRRMANERTEEQEGKRGKRRHGGRKRRVAPPISERNSRMHLSSLFLIDIQSDQQNYESEPPVRFQFRVLFIVQVPIPILHLSLLFILISPLPRSPSSCCFYRINTQSGREKDTQTDRRILETHRQLDCRMKQRPTDLQYTNRQAKRIFFYRRQTGRQTV